MGVDTCKLVSLNVRGISNFLKRRMIFTWCRKQKTDFIFLQETHSKSDTETQWKNEWEARSSCCMEAQIHVEWQFSLRKVLRKENLDEEENIILGGDFNCPLNPFLDKKGGILTPRKSVVKTIESLQDELDLVDIWRIKNPTKKSFTWGQNSPMVFSRLDYWLISNSLYDSVTGTDIVPAIKTDHSGILLEFCNNVNDIKGPGYWKMNCSLLEDDDYSNDITVKIPVWLAEGYKELSDNRNIWDWIFRDVYF